MKTLSYYLFVVLLLFFSSIPAQAQFKVIESSITQGATNVASEDTLVVTFSAKINTEVVSSRHSFFTFGRINVSPGDSIITGPVTLKNDSTIAIPYGVRPNMTYSLALFELYSGTEVMEPFVLSFSTGSMIADGSISGTLSFPEGHSEGAIVAVIPENRYTQHMLTQPLSFAVGAAYVAHGSSEFSVGHLPRGKYFVYAFGGKKPGSETALLHNKPIGLYDNDQNLVADVVELGRQSSLTDLSITLSPLNYESVTTEGFKESSTTMAKEWASDALLLGATSLTEVGPNGASDVWMWLYYSPEKRGSFGFISTGNRAIVGFPTGVDMSFFKAIDSDWVHSSVAVTAALEEATPFLADKSDTTIMATLIGGMNREFFYESAVWVVTFKADNAIRSVYIDAISGEKVSLEGVSARSAYTVISDSLAITVPDAYLTSMATSFEDVSGLAPVWLLEFYSESTTSFYVASTSAQRNPIIRARENVSGKIPPRLSDSWIDSDALLDSLALISRFPDEAIIERVGISLAPVIVPFPADTFTAWQVFAKTTVRGERPFSAIIVAETGKEFGFPRGTSENWFATAETAAQAWAPDAKLMRVNSFGGRSVDATGTSEVWNYVFTSETVTDSVLYVIAADTDSRMAAVAFDDSLIKQLPSLPNVDELLDSDEAMTIAFSADSIQTEPNPDMEFKGARMALDVVRVTPDSTISVWSVYNPMRNVETIGWKRIAINAVTGEILAAKLRTTDRTPFEVAKAAAKEWNNDARVFYASADSVNEDGTVDTWSFLFWSRKTEKAYETIVQGGTDIISQQEITDLPENVDPTKPIRGWMESTMALLKANQEVGDSLRALGELNRIRVELFASQSASKSSMTNAEDEGTDGAWKVTFEKTNGEAEAVEVNNDDVTTSAEEEFVPQSLELMQNYPNPFNPTTNISFTLPASGQVSLIVYNILGQRVAQLVRQSMGAGAHTIYFDASAMASGIYIYQLQFGEQQITRQMMLLK